ncbi:SigB/SigF/SigG family RNA polymerase sigma factor [Amycolatopsis sp. lyj-23]|uniref:SigB/SigF/SigG family RNA polymerase sigma factor n=1 Tax=Amycolatopsis sp. lyj-23 TaxID=2789283 RepID=UPI003979443F
MVVQAPERNPSAATATAPSQRRFDEYAHCAPLFLERSRLDDEDARRSALRARLITEHLPVAEHIARRFSGRGEPFDDLLQVARTGLIRAVDRYDPDRGADFLSFAVPTIMGEVRRHFRDTGWSMRVPRSLKDLQQKLSTATDTLAHDLGRAPTPSELAAHLGMSVDFVREGLLAADAYRPHSIDAPIRGGAEDPVTAADQLAVEESGFTRFDNHDALKAAMATLPARERDIIKMRFVDELPQREVAQRIGVSQMHVSRLLARTLEQLRAHLVAE